MKQFAVIGLGNFGLNVALKLSDMGMPVLVIDKDPAKIESISGKVAYARVADATDKKSLESAGVAAVNTAVVSLGKQIEPSVMATIILKELGVPEVIVKGTTPEHGKILKLVGASYVVFPDADMAERIAQKIISPNIVEHIPLLPGYSIVELKAPPTFWGKTLLDLNLRRNYGVEVLVIRRGEEVKVIPSAVDKIQEGDTLVILGKNEDLQKLKTEGEQE